VLATTIRRHRYVAVLDETDCPRSWEEKLVYYADKRVMHATVVSVHERVEDLVARYGKTPEIIERITANKRLILAIEGKIQRAMAIAIDEAIANIDE